MAELGPSVWPVTLPPAAEARHAEVLERLHAIGRAFPVAVEQDPRPAQVDVSELAALIADLRAGGPHPAPLAHGDDDRLPAPRDVRWEWTSVGTSLEQQIIPLYRAVAPAGTAEDAPVWHVTLFIGDERGPQRETTRVGSWSKRHELFGGAV